MNYISDFNRNIKMSSEQLKFRIGDPVWAKMKGFSPWPGVVAMPPSDVKRPAIKKAMHCVNFFGTKGIIFSLSL